MSQGARHLAEAVHAQPTRSSRFSSRPGGALTSNSNQFAPTRAMRCIRGQIATLQSQHMLLALALRLRVYAHLPMCAQKKPITIDTLMEPPAESHDAGGIPVWAPDGKRFAYIHGKQVMLYDVAAKSEKELLSLDPLEKAAVADSGAARFDWQNRHVGENSLEWSALRQGVADQRGRRLVSLSCRIRQMGPTHRDSRNPNTIRNSRPTARKWPSAAAMISTRSTSPRTKLPASPTTERHAAQWRARLGVSRRARFGHRVLVGARFQTYRLHAIRYGARVGVSASFAPRRCARSPNPNAIRRRELPTPTCMSG